MKKTTLKFFFFFFLITTISFSQNSSKNSDKNQRQLIRCASDAHNKKLLKKYPNMMGSQAFEDRLRLVIDGYKKQRLSSSSKRAVITIPVVVHVFHNGEDVGVAPNITDAQVESQIAVLNQDYRNLAGSIISVAADVEIEFCLAKQDESGCPINGIDRVDIGQDGIVEEGLTTQDKQNDASDKMDLLKPSTIWDPSKYLNMWSVAFKGGSGILGYAQFPGGPSNTDGVVSDYRYFGSLDYDDGSFILDSPYDKGRTMTHEVGHFLDLYHTFNGGCVEGALGGDFCADTPGVSTPNYGCSAGTDSCPAPPGSSDMIENYMDYTDDLCMNTFTDDQKVRIVAAMMTETNRMELATSSACTALAPVNYDGSILIEGVFMSNCNDITPKVRLTNYGNLPLTSATITYDIDGGSPIVHPWVGSLANEAYEIITLPLQTVLLGNHDFNASVSNPNGNTDLRNCNDSKTLNFDSANSYAATIQVHLELIPDDFGSEITWEFRDGTNTLLDSGGPYPNNDNTPINASFNVSSGECYSFTIFDSFGDGLCCNSPGSYTLKADDDSVIFSGGSYGNSETTNISTSTLGTEEYFLNNNVSIYPNPITHVLNIKLAQANDLPDGYKIYNLLGQLITQEKTKHISQLSINTSRLSNGMYFIKISKEGHSISLPFIKK